MAILPLNEVKTHFSALADEVEATHDRIIVTRNGKPHVMLIAVDDFESLQMTREILSEPEALAGIRQAEQDIAEGRHHSLDDLRQVLEERRRIEQSER
ncbi:MAG TPA: type II toxin-antitoxin system Phd/YefM family antitoxin [Mycobacteriales bacterium]|jgi:prevent-host-death family protein|nr:type II toxin-antitoxin system Phd/YefM family antitoxin [Mycobacteriales bacterium]